MDSLRSMAMPTAQVVCVTAWSTPEVVAALEDWVAGLRWLDLVEKRFGGSGTQLDVYKLAESPKILKCRGVPRLRRRRARGPP